MASIHIIKKRVRKMKYIRTKEGIYDTSNMKWCECSKQASYYKDKNYILYVPIKTANTIEELCDEFVDTSELKTSNTGGWLYDEFDSDNKCLVYYAEDERRTIPLNEFDDLSKIYGAIWTDKGLIYVAKMNKKGELELL